jgi:hypothetical protein
MENKMNEREALLIIEEMISKAKSELKDNGFYFMFWGWLVFIATIINYYLLVFTNYEYHSIPWLLMPLGGIFTVIVSIRDRKKEVRVKTYVDELMKHVVRAFVTSLIIVCFMMPLGNQWKAFYPTLMIVYASWLFISGGMLKFKPLQWGGVLNWVLAATGYFWASTEIHLMLIAIAVLGGYIIPGHMLKLQYDKQQHVQGT